MNPLLLCSFHVLALFIFHSQATNISSSTPSCHPEERSALLNFKASFTISTQFCFGIENRASWDESSDCCQWDEIRCDATTGHVIQLSLSCTGLNGIMTSNSSLFSLRHLQILDLSGNDFQGSSVPPEFGTFNNLTYLDLSSTNFGGDIPREIARLSKLSFLRIWGKEGIRIGEATMRAMAMNLTELTDLILFNVDMSAVNPLFSMANMSSSIRYLSMRNCRLRGELPDTFFGNLRKLETLYLSDNNLCGRVSFSSLNIEHLKDFDLSNNNFSGRILNNYGNSSSSNPMYFKLGKNSFEGMIPSWIFELPSLRSLDLSNNHFTGPIPSSFFQNVGLYVLDLSSNSLSGDLEIENISKLKNLTNLFLSSNKFSFNFRSSKNLSLDKMTILDLSYCNINFESSINISLDNLNWLGLRSCNLKEFPTFIKSSNSLSFLDLSMNSIQGNVPTWFGEMRNDSVSHLRWIFLSRNQFVGNIPISFCNMRSLVLLDLSHNNLNGTVPRCITNSSSSLSVLDLRMNNLRGNIPSAFAKESSLETLNLNGNRLEGSLHQSLLNCKMLKVFDIGGNNISGPFPHWLDSLPELQVLILRGNKFYGPIGSPTAIFPFQKLRIMDLSHNEFTGSLPNKYFENLLAMMDSHTDVLEYMGKAYYKDSVAVVMKGFEFQLEKILTIFTTIDLSSNNFEGDIPSSIGKLKSLKGLNLSHNNLVGHIPISLGNLSNMEWLDLSSNKLNGKIPKKLAEDLIQLSSLNLSFNALEGQIPRGKQFDTFENSSYMGNLGLCGPPLSKTCYGGKDKPQSPMSTDHEDGDEGLDWKIVMLIGYGGGLVFGVSMGYVIIHDTTIYRIMEIVNWRNQGSSKKLNGRKVRRVRRGRN